MAKASKWKRNGNEATLRKLRNVLEICRQAGSRERAGAWVGATQ